MKSFLPTLGKVSYYLEVKLTMAIERSYKIVFWSRKRRRRTKRKSMRERRRRSSREMLTVQWS